jgi:hypothetical protein
MQVVDSSRRATVSDCLAHEWLAGEAPDVAELTGAFERLRVRTICAVDFYAFCALVRIRCT